MLVRSSHVGKRRITAGRCPRAPPSKDPRALDHLNQLRDSYLALSTHPIPSRRVIDDRMQHPSSIIGSTSRPFVRHIKKIHEVWSWFSDEDSKLSAKTDFSDSISC